MTIIDKLYAHRFETGIGDAGGIMVCDAPNDAEDLHALMKIYLEPDEMLSLAEDLRISAVKIQKKRATVV